MRQAVKRPPDGPLNLRHDVAAGALDATLAADPVQPLIAGTLVGEFVLDWPCSSGGFGTVYRARHISTGRLAAVKVLHATLMSSPEMVERFQRESATLMKLRHPNLVQVLATGTMGDGRPWFAMEWIEGHTLAEELGQRGSFRAEEAMAVVEDLCAVLQEAHDHGIVHRDLKATNVMVIPVGDWFSIKLVDFGIAKFLESPEGQNVGLTTTGQRLGTPHNMAPEQILGAAIDARTDIYALGILFYQLVTGRYPFDGTSAVEIEELHLTAPPPLASDIASVPEFVDRVILRCLEKVPDRRYPTVGALLEDLRRGALEARRGGAGGAEASGLGDRARAVPRKAIGVNVAVPLDMLADDTNDELLHALEGFFDRVRRALEQVGLSVVQERGCEFLAAALLPEESADRSRKCAEVLNAVLQVADQIALRWPDTPVTMTVHVAGAMTAGSDDDPKLVGGELYASSEWTASPGRRGVFTTEDVLVGLEHTFVVVCDEGRLLRLEGRRS